MSEEYCADCKAYDPIPGGYGGGGKAASCRNAGLPHCPMNSGITTGGSGHASGINPPKGQDEGLELERGLEIIHSVIRDVNMRLKAKGMRLEAKPKIKRLRLLEALAVASPEGKT